MMEGLLSLLLFAVLFFVMMRFGCGAHMKHGGMKGHAADEQTRHSDAPEKNIDPVCGMEVEVEQGYGKMHEGTLYRLCSRDCLDKFEADPQQYVTTNLTHEYHHEGGAT